MRKLSKAGLWMSAFAAAFGLAMFVGNGEVQAQKNYLEVFAKTYPDLKAAVETTKCNVCHVDGKGKKERNDYGKAVGEALGEKKVKEESKVEAALKKAEAGTHGGKTFGEIIKGGALPAAK